MTAMMPQAGGPGPTDLCAVVLAAGQGRRLRPITLVRPKPLCPVGNVALLDLAIGRARTAVGTAPAAVAVNVHHQRQRIQAHLAADGRLGPVHVSVEPDEALGTAGALGHMRDWIGGRDVLVLNGDTWSPGDLAEVAAGWDGERIRLLVAGDDRLRPTSAVAGAFMPWSDVARLAPVPSGLWEASWRAAQPAGRIEVVRWDRPCLDCGTPARYLAANLAAGGDTVVGEGAVVEGTLERAVVWAGARVLPGEHLVDAVRTDAGVTVLVR